MVVMLRGIDISHWQMGLNIDAIASQVEFVIIKATEGNAYVDQCCDPFVQKCKSLGKPWGFYHFGRNNNAKKEATYFINNTVNYFGEGIPILDWEDNQSVSWVNEFVNVIHDQTGVWPWIYGNPWRFEQGGVERNCGRWLAHYFSDNIRTYAQAESHKRPSAPGLVCAWQFTSSGRLDGYAGNLDLDLFFGDEAAWQRYALGDNGSLPDEPDVSVLESDEYKVTIERKS